MKHLTAPRRRRAYTAPEIDIIALEPAMQLLGISDADYVVDLHDEEKHVYEDDVW